MVSTYYFDIGNSYLKLWHCCAGQVVARYSAAHGGNPAALLTTLASDFSLRPSRVLGASVLGDQANSAFSEACLLMFKTYPEYASSHLCWAGVTNAYGLAAASLGVDRWLALLAVADAGQEVCVVDAGTATTIDVLAANGQHRGGYILPGLALMSAALQGGTERVRFTPVADGLSLGVSTAQAVTHGAMAAQVALIQQVAEGNMALVVTGGDGARLAAWIQRPYRLEPELLLRGLQRYFAHVV